MNDLHARADMWSPDGRRLAFVSIASTVAGDPLPWTNHAVKLVDAKVAPCGRR